MVGYRPDEPTGDWLCWIERECGLLASLFGGREKKKIARSAAEAISKALQDAHEVSDVRW